MGLSVTEKNLPANIQQANPDNPCLIMDNISSDGLPGTGWQPSEQASCSVGPLKQNGLFQYMGLMRKLATPNQF